MAGKSRERGQVRKRGEQKYLIRAYLGRVNGKRKYASKTIHGSKKKADRTLVKWLRELDTDTFVEPQKSMTVSDLMDEWLASRVNIQESTRRGYQYRIDNQINPFIGFLKLNQLTELRLQALFERLSETIGPKTLQMAKSALNQAFKMAIRRRYVLRNPCRDVTIRRKRNTKDTKQVLTPQEVNKVLEVAEGSRYEALWHVLLGTGMRPQEACALRWSDIEGSKVTLRRVLKDWNSRTRLRWEGEGKTRQSLGTLSLPQSVLVALEEHRRRQTKEFLETGIRPDHDWIFTTQDGLVPIIQSIRKYWGKLLDKADVERVRLYDTRHTHATQLLAAGVHPKVVQGRLRHSSIKTTMDTYTHLTQEMDTTAADVFDQVRNLRRTATG